MTARFLLTQRTCVEYFPPTLNQAALLSGVGDVTLLDAVTASDPSGVLTPNKIKRVRITLPTARTPVLKLLQKLLWWNRYVREFRRLLTLRPEVVIAYEPEAASLLLNAYWLSQKTTKIVHLHEVPWKEHYAASRRGRYALESMLKNLHRTDMVVVPDSHRADFVQKVANLKVRPLVVMNCPRLQLNLPPSLLTPFLFEKGITTTRIVHYQGAVGPDHNIDGVILSMRWWPQDAVFVIVGGTGEQYRKQLNALAEKQNVRERVIFVGRVPYDQVFGYAVGAMVGVTLLDSTQKNWEMSAGASNKRFEYIALGIPQVTNDGPGIRELFEETGVAQIANYHDVEDIGRKIAHYLTDAALCADIAQRARQLHLETYNYEHQFQPLMENILRLTNAKEQRA